MNLSDISMADLLAELELRRAKAKLTETENEYEAIKNLKLGNFTTKDVLVTYGDYDGEGRFSYSFSLVYKDKPYCFYYDWRDYEGGRSKPKDWWPVDGDDNRAWEFLPSGFNEDCENSFSSGFSLDETIEILKKCGYERFEKSESSET